MNNQRLVVIGDTHFPYHKKPALRQLLALIEKLQPTHVVQIGDLYDMYGFSRYPRSLNHESPLEEIHKGRSVAELMWSRIRAKVPGAKLYQLLGNHDIRMRKRVAERLPELEGLFRDKELFDFDGVESMDSDRDTLELTVAGYKLAIHHGFLKAGEHINYFGRNVVVGHSHQPGVWYQKHHRGTFFELNAGYIGDEQQHVFRYGATSFKRWTRACGVVDSTGAHVLPLV